MTDSEIIVPKFTMELSKYDYGILIPKYKFQYYITNNIINDQSGIGLMVYIDKICENILIHASNFNSVAPDVVTDILFFRNLKRK